MARVAGVDIPNNKRGAIALTYVFGIGRTSAMEIMVKAGLDPNKKVKEMTEDELNRIRQVIDTEYQTEGNLRSEVRMNIKRLMDIGCYRGLRHRRGLPCHGQRTRTNSRTRKGPRKTIANKKKAPTK
ncbi:MAG: 30S ribosomal protein S13 [Chitinispirillales bacterium]|jgi:small subunit ribosomal protein S13|nr:30S ribosomal protein S13 [Chitinispirillales bacterium]